MDKKFAFFLIPLLFLGSISFYLAYAQNIDSLKIVSSKAPLKERYATEIALSQAYLIRDKKLSYRYVKQALESALRSKDQAAIAKAHRWMGEWYQNNTQYAASAASYWKAIQLAQKIKDKKIESAALNGLGITYYLQADYIKAEELILKAAQLRYEIKDYTYYSVILTNLAAIHFQNKSYPKAIRLLRQTERELLKQPEGTYMASLYNTLGGSYQMAYPEKDSAAFYYKKSIDVAQRLNIPQNVMTGYHNLGERALRQKDYTEALNYLHKALSIGKKLGNDTYVMQIYHTLSETYAAQGDFKMALTYKKNELELNQQLFEKDKQKIIKELEFKYETARKDQKLLEQEEQIQKAQLKAATEKNKRNTLLFVLVLVLLLVLFGVVYLMQRKAAKEKITQEKARIFENIVHDIRTPVTLIKGPLAILKNEPLSAEAARQLLHIDQQSLILVNLVNELLDASKLEKKGYQPIWKIGQPWIQVQQQLIPFESLVQDKKINVEVSLDLNEQPLYYPADVIEKVVANILSNALKFAPPKATISIEGVRKNDFLRIRIHNTGTSLSSQAQKKIFERFYRQEIHQTYPGSGIGLAIVEELLALVGGTIAVENTNTGVQFIATIPIKTSIPEVPNEIVKNEKPVLLLIEDHSGIKQWVEEILASDFTLITAADGKEGISIALEHLPDIILTDLLMPNTDGFEVITTLKNNPKTASTPILICSSKNSEASRIDGLRLGAAAYIAKPFHPEELKLTLQSVWLQELMARKKYQEQAQNALPCRERLQSTHTFVNTATEIVFQNLEQAEFDVNDLAEALHLSRSQLHRKLTQLTGLSATQFIKRIRLEQAKDYLKSGTFNITETAYRCGFNSQSYFSKSFQEYTGHPPSQLYNSDL